MNNLKNSVLEKSKNKTSKELTPQKNRNLIRWTGAIAIAASSVVTISALALNSEPNESSKQFITLDTITDSTPGTSLDTVPDTTAVEDTVLDGTYDYYSILSDLYQEEVVADPLNIDTTVPEVSTPQLDGLDLAFWDHSESGEIAPGEVVTYTLKVDNLDGVPRNIRILSQYDDEEGLAVDKVIGIKAENCDGFKDEADGENYIYLTNITIQPYQSCTVTYDLQTVSDYSGILASHIFVFDDTEPNGNVSLESYYHPRVLRFKSVPQTTTTSTTTTTPDTAPNASD